MRSFCPSFKFIMCVCVRGSSSSGGGSSTPAVLLRLTLLWYRSGFHQTIKLQLFI